MALSNRPRPFRDSSLFVIGLEGEIAGAEYQYFQEVLRVELLDHRRVRFEFLPTSSEQHRSDPEAVFARVKQYAEEHGLQPFDRAWIVLDFDSWGARKLSSVALKVQKCGYSLAVSNPCFELWLLLHHEEFDLTTITVVGARGRSAVAKSAWRARKMTISRGAVIRACLRARQIAAVQPKGARWPSGPGSYVYRIFDDLADQKAYSAKID